MSPDHGSIYQDPKAMNTQSSYLIFLIAAFLSSTFVYCVNLWFSVSGFYLVLSTVFLLLTIVLVKRNLFTTKKIDFESILVIILFVFSILSFTINVEDVNGFLSLAMWINRFAMFLAPLAILLYFVKKINQPFLGRMHKNKYKILLVISLVIQLTVIRIVKIPDIDVYQVLRNGPLRLMALENPYETGATNLLLSSKDYGYHHYAYGPATIFLFLPFDLLLHEPRYLLILANFLAVFSLYSISKKFWRDNKIAEIISLIYLFNPRLVYFLTFSWTDGLIISLVALSLLFFSKKRMPASGVLLALVVGIKIFYALPFIFFLKNKGFINKKFIIWGLLTFLFLHLPFILHNWQAMYKSIVTINAGGEVFAQLQRFSLTLATFIDRQFMYYPPQFVFPLVAISAVVVFWLVISPTLSLARTLVVVGLVFITTVFLGPIANANYYFTASQILLLAIAASGDKNLIYD